MKTATNGRGVLIYSLVVYQLKPGSLRHNLQALAMVREIGVSKGILKVVY